MFNICGTSSSQCLPTWRPDVFFGNAVQVRRGTALTHPTLPVLVVACNRQFPAVIHISLLALFFATVLWLALCTMQFWGDAPVCNTTAPGCVDSVTGQPVCCTADCEVLSTGVPIWSLQDTNNPLFGGLVLQHESVSPS